MPHVHAAISLALLPWGDFLLRLGLVDGAELAAGARESRGLSRPFRKVSSG